MRLTGAATFIGAARGVPARALLAALLPAALLGGCAAPRINQAPSFATVPYDPFSRGAAIAIAQREWRLFGSPVDDDPPGTRAPLSPEQKPERQEGLWQRVGEYWYEGQNADAPEVHWTGKHDADGVEFSPSRDGDYAWSAAFISYVMRIAGAGGGFPYAANHATYIGIGWQMARGLVSGYDLVAERPDIYPPEPGDLICTGRAGASGMTYDDLPGGSYPSHCDIVVEKHDGALSVIGGNVDDAVTLKHVPIAADGRLVGPAGVLDPRYGWFVVLRMLYAR